VDQLISTCRELSASVVYFNNVYDPLSLIRDYEVKRQLGNAGIVARNFNAELLFEPVHVLDDRQSPFTTFEAFWERRVSGILRSSLLIQSAR
jgi:cryptochrome 1